MAEEKPLRTVEIALDWRVIAASPQRSVADDVRRA